MENALEKELARHPSATVMLAYGEGSAIRSGLLGKVSGILLRNGRKAVEFGGIMPNPTLAKVHEGAEMAGKENVGLILAVGGGSVSDCAKMIAVQARSEDDIWETDIKNGKYGTPAEAAERDAIDVGTIVTAAGTGSDQNNDAVITNEAEKIKCDLYGRYPLFSILDPSLTLTVPAAQYAAGAFDSLSHAMETYFGKETRLSVSDAMNEAVMRDIIANMRKGLAALRKGNAGSDEDISARGELMWDAAIAENGILKAGKKTDFQCHMIEHQLGAYTDCSHGRGLAVLHPVLYRRLAEFDKSRFADFAVNVWGIPRNAGDDNTLARLGVERLESFIKECGLPSDFRELGAENMLDGETLRKIAASTIISDGCAHRFSPIEILSVLKECM